MLCSISFSCDAEQILEWNVNFSSKVSCNTESDICHTVVTLIDQDERITKINRLVGPIIVAISNWQIVSCESNAILKTNEAKFFDLSGSEVASVKHRGFLRNCGITPDGKLYWFHYNKILDSKPVNILVVVTSIGDVVYEKTLAAGGEIRFTQDSKEYVVPIGEPEWPG